MALNTASTRDVEENEPVIDFSKSDYEQFCAYLEKTSGITLGANKFYLVQSRLRKIMEDYKLHSLADLVRMLAGRKHLTLEKQVIDAMTTNETSWFRDIYPFEYLEETILSGIPMSQQKPFRIWSAACSYGHEAYSISMVVQEFLQKNPGRIPAGLEIMGTDLSSRALARATAGCYDYLDMSRGLSEERKRMHFHKKADTLQVREEIKNRVTFRNHNLVTNSFPLGMFDVIFCRNVLIYFSKKNKQAILNNIVKSLAPGGYLFLGASEPMVDYSDGFNIVPSDRGVVYQLKQGKRLWM